MAVLPRKKAWQIVVTIVLVGINLRPFLTGPGPVIDDIIASTGMSYSQVSLLTLLPMILMGVGALIVPFLQPYIQARKGLQVAMLMLLLGSFSRAYVSDGNQLLFTALFCGLSVAYIQAIFPGIIKAWFGNRTPIMMGLYSAMLMGGGALGAQLSPILTEPNGHWQNALAWFALPASFAFIAITVSIKKSASQSNKVPLNTLIWRPRTGLLILDFGFVNAGYASVITWLAPFYQSLGMPSAQSGSLVAILSLFQASAALIIPFLAAKNHDRRFWLLLTLASQVIGFLAIMLMPMSAPYLWSIFLGCGLGGCFSVMMIVALDHIPHPAQAGALSALMQGGGFIIAAFGPLVAVWLRQSDGSFTYAWAFHAVLVVLTMGLFSRLNPNHYAKAYPDNHTNTEQ
ncbi:cyanate transport protein [Proteus hauseri ATCC 700826]|uniref:Cyanate transport protein n=1 Tax=Proteus hauseri ATCC 700826 TaxID=1354271 RepID=A0AAJ3HUB4_PROHU|nr:cyanate transporter [Proteus hauseri]OAT48884.1 cyanate transport protein [Proteus hauseri ATCC 700826]